MSNKNYTPSSQKSYYMIGMPKRSNPTVRQFQINKQNIHPNTKDNRVKSHHHKSPAKKIIHVKSTNKGANNASQKGIQSQDKTYQSYHSSELQKNVPKQTDNICLRENYVEEYYSSHSQDKMKIEKEDKVRVTLKDLKRHRKSVQTNNEQNEYSDKMLRESMSRGHLIKKREEQSRKIQHHWCLNHPQKIATCKLLPESSDQYYCEKCAIGLATEGYQIRRLEKRTNIKKDNQITRSQQLRNFLFELDKLEPQFRQSTSQINEMKQFLSNKYNEQQNVLNNLYGSLVQIIGQYQKESLLTLKIFYDSLFEQLQKSEGITEGFSFIKEDILPNINLIVDESVLSEDNFRKILDEHQNTLAEIYSNIQEINISRTYYEVDSDLMEEWIHRQAKKLKAQIVEKVKGPMITSRLKSLNNSEGKNDPFRLSFGKEMESASKQLQNSTLNSAYKVY